MGFSFFVWVGFVPRIFDRRSFLMVLGLFLVFFSVTCFWVVFDCWVGCGVYCFWWCFALG